MREIPNPARRVLDLMSERKRLRQFIEWRKALPVGGRMLSLTLRFYGQEEDCAIDMALSHGQEEMLDKIETELLARVARLEQSVAALPPDEREFYEGEG